MDLEKIRSSADNEYHRRYLSNLRECLSLAVKDVKDLLEYIDGLEAQVEILEEYSERLGDAIRLHKQQVSADSSLAPVADIELWAALRGGDNV